MVRDYLPSPAFAQIIRFRLSPDVLISYSAPALMRKDPKNRTDLYEEAGTGSSVLPLAVIRPPILIDLLLVSCSLEVVRI